MRIDKIQTTQYKQQTFGWNSSTIHLQTPPISTSLEKTLIENKSISKIGQFISNLKAKFIKPKASTAKAIAENTATKATEEIIQKPFNPHTKEVFLNKLIQDGKIEGVDYKVCDLDHCKYIEEKDTEAGITRIARFRNDGSINVIAEYNAKTQRLIKAQRYDELGNPRK